MIDSPEQAPVLARDRARQHRRLSTDAERKLWAHLRNNQRKRMKFRRQHPIDTYMADFLCLQARLVVEVADGGHDDEQRRRADAARIAFLDSQGFRVLRFWNEEVLNNIDGVLERIAEYI